jgi:hypothetical protein
MEHRHIHTRHWSKAAIDSALERGDLKDWQELFVAVQSNRHVAELVLKVAAEHDLGGASHLAKALVKRLCPGFEGLKTPERTGGERA